mgnify:CR=1 FL=1
MKRRLLVSLVPVALAILASSAKAGFHSTLVTTMGADRALPLLRGGLGRNA